MSKKIETGKILIAEPFMEDSNFKRSVICICDHTEEEGTVGFILNKPLKMKVHELITDVNTEEDFNVYYGGPVANDTLHYIHNVGELLEESIPVARGVYWSGNFDKLKFLINSELIKPHNIRFFVGYSGWSEGQLADELKTGSWVMSDLHANYIFKTRSTKLWQQALDNKGDTYSVIAQMPKKISLN